MTPQTSPITTLEALRTIAHPARIRLYELLLLDGPATVSQLAAKASLAIGSASYHLRLLHRAGFVEEAPGTSHDRRTHWWRAVPGGLHWSPADFLDTPSGRDVSTTAQRLLTERRVRRLAGWNATWHRWAKEWIDAAVETDAVLHLTPEELAQFATELQETIRRWATRDRGGEPSSDRRPVFVVLGAFPVGERE